MALRVAKAANNGPTAPQSGSEFAVRLYAEVHSIALYATSMWAADARASRHICALLHIVQRRVPIRAIRGYRTTRWRWLWRATPAGVPSLDEVENLFQY